jgi:tetratricopeptide (TPR) repeat protein
MSQRHGWNDDLARCRRLLGRFALAAGDTAAAGEYLTAAATGLRDGDFLPDLATTLTDLAEHSRTLGDLDAAERHAVEAITIASPRGLAPALSAALSARARIRASQAIATTGAGPDLLYQGRDAADAALRLATQRHRLAWRELDALRAHAALDLAEGADHGWAAKADALQTRLVPPGLDPDPLATIGKQVEAQLATDRRDKESND